MVRKIKLFLSDVDGVLTDGGMYYSDNGDELKKFHTYDGVAFSILRDAGIKTGVITSEATNIVNRRASKLDIDYLFQGKKCEDKLESAIEICNKENIGLDMVSYIGDDYNCIDLLKAVGFRACPSSATRKVKKIEGIIQLEKAGGEGVVREWVELLIEKNLV